MKIETTRLVIKPLSSSDSKMFFDLSQNLDFKQFQISNYQRQSTEEAAQWIATQQAYLDRNGIGIVGIFENTSQKLIGLAALRYLGTEKASKVELIYRLDDQFLGKGFGFETGKALIDYAFNIVKLDSLVASIDPKNDASKKALKKLGFECKEVIKIGIFDEELHVLNRPR